jgi:two-component system, LytTR family, sensor kinase
MMNDKTAGTSLRCDFLLSWDRLGFRVLVFSGLALMWILQGRLMGEPWQDLLRAELGGLLPWAFLAPLVLSLNARIRMDRLGLWRFLAGHLVGMLLVFVPYWLILRGISLAWKTWSAGWRASNLAVLAPTGQNLLGGFLSVPFVYLLILLGAEAMRHADARRIKEAQAGNLARQLAEARLALLQRQVNPHFLFNALQAISTLLHRDPAVADSLLLQLSALLRAMLEDASERTIDVRTELDLSRKYLAIEQVRFGDRLCVEWQVSEAVCDAHAPSLIVLPLVENAIRHGLSRKVGPGRLRITAGREGSQLLICVEDDGLGATLPLPAGVGIANTRERLQAMYARQASLEIDTRPGAGFRASVRLPLDGAAS